MDGDVQADMAEMSVRLPTGEQQPLLIGQLVFMRKRLLRLSTPNPLLFNLASTAVWGETDGFVLCVRIGLRLLLNSCAEFARNLHTQGLCKLLRCSPHETSLYHEEPSLTSKNGERAFLLNPSANKEVEGTPNLHKAASPNVVTEEQS